MSTEVTRALAIKPQLSPHRLQAVLEIPNPRLIPRHKLDLWLEYSRKFAKNYGNCPELEFNGINPDILKILGFTPNLPSRVLYLQTQNFPDGHLVINPRFTPTTDSPFTTFDIETCSHIGHAQYPYIYEHPLANSVYYHYYDGKQQIKPVQEKLMDKVGSYYQHGWEHLNGWTKLNRHLRASLVDLRNADQQKTFTNNYLQHYFDDIRSGILTFDATTQRFIAHDESFKTIKTFRADLTDLLS